MRDVQTATGEVETLLRVSGLEKLDPALLRQVCHLNVVTDLEDLVGKGVLPISADSRGEMRASIVLQALRLSIMLIPPMHHGVHRETDVATPGCDVGMAVNGPTLHAGPNPQKL